MTDIRAALNELTRELEKVKEGLNLPQKEVELKALEGKSTEADFWKDHVKARELMQKLSEIKKELDAVEGLEREIRTAKTEEDVMGIEKEMGRLKVATYFTGEYDRGNALVSIHAGQGGTEAMDWASMLFRMYVRYCERKDWPTQVIDETPGEETGIKSITFKVAGSNAYGHLKGEAGTHRLVRQSPFNADKLRQTSFALVEVLPELDETSEIEVKEEELEWQFFRASSQGGQNVQKVSTAVRLKHLPTGLVVTAQAERFQEQNRKAALSLLKSKLWQKQKEAVAKEKKELKGGKTQASWGTQIRSYVLHPYKMVKDVRTGVETANTEAVLDGDLDEFIEAELKLATSQP